MPNIKSAKKRVKVIATKTLQNKALNSALKTQIKKANAAIDSNAGDKEAAVRAAVKKIDQAAAKGLAGHPPYLRYTQKRPRGHRGLYKRLRQSGDKHREYAE